MLPIPTDPAAWMIATSIAAATGAMYKAYRLGHDVGGPIAEKYLL